MLIYVAHEFVGNMQNVMRAKQITDKLQANDLENCYICSLTTLPILRNDNISVDSKNAIKLDLLCASDMLIVASNYGSGELDEEIDLAKKLLNADGQPMEVKYLEHNRR